MQFVQRLSKIKQEYGLTNIKIAEYANVSESAVRSWLTDFKVPNALAVALLCERLNVSADYLLGIENSEKQELLALWDKLDPMKQAEFKGLLMGYIKAKEESELKY